LNPSQHEDFQVYNAYKQSKKSELVRKQKEKENVLDSIWGGLRSIDKDKFVEDRAEVLRK